MSNMSINTPAAQRSQSAAGQAALKAPPGKIDQADAASGNEPVGAVVKNAADAKNKLNVQILQSTAEVSIKAGDNSQTLLFRAAIDHINELLAPELGTDAIQSKSSEDNSPEATAQRILSLSTAFYDAYAAQHPDKDPAQLAKDFVGLIRGGFEQGFGEAKDILQGLKVFGGDIESGVMKTYDLVSKGYDDFLAGKLQAFADSNAPASEPAAA